MADSIAIQRTATGKITNVERIKILKALATPKLLLSYKRTILNWLKSQAPITAGSDIETALTYVSTHVIALW